MQEMKSAHPNLFVCLKPDYLCNLAQQYTCPTAPHNAFHTHSIILTKLLHGSSKAVPLVIMNR